MEIKIKCPDCNKEIKVLLHIVDKLQSENEQLKKELNKLKNDNIDMPNFFKELFK